MRGKLKTIDADTLLSASIRDGLKEQNTGYLVEYPATKLIVIAHHGNTQRDLSCSVASIGFVLPIGDCHTPPQRYR